MFFVSSIINGWNWLLVEDVLLGLLCCKTNDAVNKFLLPAIAYSKEGKEEERLWWLVACGWSRGEGRLLYAEAFYGLRSRSEK